MIKNSTHTAVYELVEKYLDKALIKKNGMRLVKYLTRYFNAPDQTTPLPDVGKMTKYHNMQHNQILPLK
jgi:hypothetical protein